VKYASGLKKLLGFEQSDLIVTYSGLFIPMTRLRLVLIVTHSGLFIPMTRLRLVYSHDQTEHYYPHFLSMESMHWKEGTCPSGRFLVGASISGGMFLKAGLLFCEPNGLCACFPKYTKSVKIADGLE